MRRFVAVIAVIALLASVPIGGCGGALIPLIHTVAIVVAEITGALDDAEAVVKGRPDADPAVVARVVDAIEKARAALRVVQAAARATDSVASKDYVAAVESLTAAYQAVLDLAESFGVRGAPVQLRGRLGAAPPGILLVPTVSELRNGLMARADVAVGEVAPKLAAHDAIHRGGAHQEPTSYRGTSDTDSAESANRVNVVVGELGGWVRGTRNTRVAVATLGVHVGDVVGGGAEEQVRRVTARPVVAAVADEDRGASDRTVRDDPRQAVRPLRLGLSVHGDRELAVPRPRHARDPRPAGIGPAALVDLAPEPCDERFVHEAYLLVGHAPGCSRSAGALQNKHRTLRVQPLAATVDELRLELMREPAR